MKGVLSALILPVLFLMGTAASASTPPPTFTGNVEADFTNAEVLIVPDPSGVGDVGLPGAFPPGTISGFDIADVRLFYDRAADVLYVGINFAGIAGDADGDGDPGGTSPILQGLGGIDFPSFGDSESFAVGFDTNRDGLVDAVAGVSALVDITGFTTAAAVLPECALLGLAFGLPLPDNTGMLFSDPSAAEPDIEFTVPRFSELPGSPQINRFDDSVLFNICAFAGSFADSSIGEDVVNPYLLTLGKTGFDTGLEDGALITDQFANEGMTILGSSDCGLPGAYVNNPFDNPETDDLIPDSGMFVLTTKCDPLDDTSDSGTYDLTFVNPLDPLLPSQAVFFALTCLDVEDSGTPGRGTSHAQFFNAVGSLITDIPLPSGPNANQFMLAVEVDGMALIEDAIRRTVIKIGDTDDSGAVDTVCYNLAPSQIAFNVGIHGPTSAVHPGGLIDLSLTVENPTNQRQEGIVVVTAGRSPRSGSVTIIPERRIRLRRHFTNEDTPFELAIPVPTSLREEWMDTPIRVSVKILQPRTRRIIAQDIVDVTITHE